MKNDLKQPMAPSIKNRLKIESLTFDIRQKENTHLLIMRNDRGDLPHLTISFNNPGKTINVHLTKRTKEKEDQETIVKIPEAELGMKLASFLPIFLDVMFKNLYKLRGVRPGWLGRKGYCICYFDQSSEDTLLEYMFPSRRHHGKDERYASRSGFEEYIKSGEIEKTLHPPSVLHQLALSEFKDVIFAFRILGKHRPQIMPLICRQKPNGKFGWIRVDKLIQAIKSVADDIFIPAVIAYFLNKDDWTKIYNGLQLSELDFELG
jgi:hypothetical protein